MNELLKIILSLSLSGALLILVLLLCKPLVKNKLSKRWQYYIWLIVVVRLLLPLAPETNLMGTIFQHFDNAVIQTDTSPQPEQEPPILPEIDFPNQYNIPSQAGSGNGEQREPIEVTAPSMFEMLKQNIAAICLLVWLIVAVGLLIRKVTVYQSFAKYIKAGRIEISDMQLWERVGKLVEQTGIKGSVGLYTNSLISSPLLVGFFRPCIMLPTIELSDSDFQYTILHELTHYKRRDMFYKWLVQMTICLHWFNPFVYYMGREVNRACELSCDEAVIKSLDARGRRAYGDTLLNAMGMGGNYKDSLASVTLTEGKELLKERLDSIMNFKKTTRKTVAISIALAFALCFGATTAGAYTAIPVSAKNEQVSNNEDTTIYSSGDGNYFLFYGGAAKDDIPTISSVEGKLTIILVEKGRYTTFGPFENASEMVSGVTKQCADLVSKSSISQKTAIWVQQKSKLIQEIENYLTPQSAQKATLFTPDSTGKVVIPISIETMSENTAVCIGEIPNIGNATSIDYNITCDGNNAILSAGLRKPTLDSEWFFRVEKEVLKNNYSVQSHFDNSFNSQMGVYESYNGNYQFYVQNKGGILSNISGTITVQYDLNMVKQITNESVPAGQLTATPPVSYVIECDSEKIIVKQGGTDFKIEVDPASKDNYTVRDNRNIPMGERYYRYNKWDIVFSRNSELPPSAVYSSTITLTIPESLKEQELCLVTSSGDIQIDSLDNVNLIIESESGSISIEDTKATSISAKAENGNVQLARTISTGDIIARSDYGVVSVVLDDSNIQYSVKVNTEATASISINGKHYNGGEFTVGAGGTQTITLDGENNTFTLSNINLFNATVSDTSVKRSSSDGKEINAYWTKNEFIDFMEEQEREYKALLTSGDITRQEYDTFIAADKAILKEIENGSKILKSATGSIENGIGT